MKKLSAIIVSMCLVLGLTGTVFAADTGEKGNKLSKELFILYTGDVHCGVDRNFSYAGLYEAKKSFENDGKYVLLVDNGDSIQGEPIGEVTKGEANIELMNTLSYNIAIPGTHEFDYGTEQFLSLAKMADFPYISCNFERQGKLVFDPYVIKEFDGVKVAFVGVTTPKTLTESDPKYFQDEKGDFIYDFCQDKTGKKLYDAVQKAVDDARAEGADYCIVLGHLGIGEDDKPWRSKDVIENTTGIDAFLDAHSHDSEQIKVPNRDGEEIPRSACGTKLNGIGWCRITPEGEISCGVYNYSNDISAAKLFNIKNEAGEALDRINSRLEESLNKKNAVTPNNVKMYRVYVTDPDGKGVEDVLVQLCDDKLCRIGRTDKDGLASFEAAAKPYEVHIPQVPEGYEETDEVWNVPGKYCDLNIVLKR
ncbi:MAG: metallophosphoesterase [Lachnospiraceae bacterium]|nr:metallophosphoesterase [Lachnospiraceae bacterium]